MTSINNQIIERIVALHENSTPFSVIQRRIQVCNVERLTLKLVVDAANYYQVTIQHLLLGTPKEHTTGIFYSVDWVYLAGVFKQYIETTDPNFDIHHKVLWQSYCCGKKKPGVKYVFRVFSTLNIPISTLFLEVPKMGDVCNV